MNEENFPDPYKDCQPLEPDNDKTIIANLRVANDEMFTRLEDKDVALAAANREILQLRSVIRMSNEALTYTLVGMKSASIAGQMESPEKGMTWLNNCLWGPGNMPTDEELEMGAQSFYDKNSVFNQGE